jgi:cytoskeletal protein CcmA (bactofilin family)
MFTDKKSKTPAIVGNQQNRITEGTSITGDLISKSGMRIDGQVQGNVKTPSKVVLGETGVIKGTLECENADIEGKFSGNMTISGTLTLRATAQVDGDVVAGKLAIEPGAAFNATCVMKGSVKQIIEKKTENEESIKTQNHLFERQERSSKPKTEQSV